MPGDRIDLALGAFAIIGQRDQVVADVVRARVHVRQAAFEEADVVCGRPVEVGAVIVGAVVGVEVTQQRDVLAVHPAAIEQRQFPDFVLGHQSVERVHRFRLPFVAPATIAARD